MTTDMKILPPMAIRWRPCGCYDTRSTGVSTKLAVKPLSVTPIYQIADTSLEVTIEPGSTEGCAPKYAKVSDSFRSGLLDPARLPMTFETVLTTPAFAGAHEGVAPTQMVLETPPMSVPVATVAPAGRWGSSNQPTVPTAPCASENPVVASTQ